jgi:hypothetical protein
MKNFKEEIEKYEYTSFSDRNKLYFKKIGYEPKDIIAIMDFKNNVFRTENNTYSLDEFPSEFVNHFREFASVENRKLDELPLTQEVLDATDYILDEAYIPEYERPKKAKYNASVEQMKLAFHYEMTILARLQDKVNMTTDELLHEIGPIGMREGVEEVEKVILEEHGKPEEKASIRDESIIASVTKEVVDVSTKVVNEISEELIDEPIFEEPEFGEDLFNHEIENFEEDFMGQLY